MRVSSPFLIRALVLSLLATGSFYLGLYFYSTRAVNSLEIGNIKNFSASILESIQEDFQLTVDGKPYTISRSTIATWPEKYVRSYNNQEDLRLSAEKIQNTLGPIADQTKTKPVNARLSFSGGRAVVFTPAVSGKEVNLGQTANSVATAIYGGRNQAAAVLDYTEPEITLEKVNNLGITTLIGAGQSDFSGSPPSRIHNIKVATEIFNGLILKPGEEFSFNNFLGEVDAEQGYKPELVIKSGKLEYEYGGGVCQVSTTVFRVAINSGFPIKERSPHSFPVKYYNPQGFDSTVYPGVVDLKFVNDAPGHILIQGKVIGNILSFEIYGTDDGRKVTVQPPVQYDINPDGSMKAYFSRTVVTANGQEKTDTFRSNYKAPVKYESNPLE